MTLTTREFWTAFHGMILGAAFLLAFTGSAVSLWVLRADWTTPVGRIRTTRTLLVGTWTMAVLAWLTVLIGTFVIYPWYRAAPPKGTPVSMLVSYPKALLISKPQTAGWHEFGMEWKEHVGWIAPFFATAVAVAATMSRRQLASETRLRQAMLVLLSVSFFCAGVAGCFGALIDKMAPVR
jgi:hypothetical protein